MKSLGYAFNNDTGDLTRIQIPDNLKQQDSYTMLPRKEKRNREDDDQVDQVRVLISDFRNFNFNVHFSGKY